MTPQLVQVRNGDKTTLVVSTAMPVQWVQWVQSVAAQSATLSASGVSGGSAGVAVNHGLFWMQAGQSLKVLPHWPGGKSPVSLEVDVQSAGVSPHTGAELADQTRSQLMTTVNLPLGQWTTIAISGSNLQPIGVYGSQSSSNRRRLLRVRVLAP